MIPWILFQHYIKTIVRGKVWKIWIKTGFEPWPQQCWCNALWSHEANWGLGAVSRKSRELFGPEKLFIKLQLACFEKLILLHVFNIRKTKRIAKFEGLEPWRCEDIKGIVEPEIGLKSFGTFEKQAPGHYVGRSITVFTLDCITHTFFPLKKLRKLRCVLYTESFVLDSRPSLACKQIHEMCPYTIICFELKS